MSSREGIVAHRGGFIVDDGISMRRSALKIEAIRQDESNPALQRFGLWVSQSSSAARYATASAWRVAPALRADGAVHAGQAQQVVVVLCCQSWSSA